MDELFFIQTLSLDMHVKYVELKLKEEILILGTWYMISYWKQDKHILAMVGYVIYYEIIYGGTKNV